MDYKEKLLDPRWQKKRLEVLSREDFTCEVCKSTTKTLHVHHKTYVYGKDPWDYDELNFQVLCVDCHQEEEFYKEELEGLIHDLLLMGYSNKDIYIEVLSIFYPRHLQEESVK